MLNTANRTSTTVEKPRTHIEVGVDSGATVQNTTPQIIPTMFVPAAQTILESMPADVKNNIFTLTATPVEYQHGLLALAKASKNMRSSVLDFMRNDENGKVFSATLKIGPAPLWQAQAKVLTQHAKIYRKDFLMSAASIFNNVVMKLTGDMATGALTRFKAIEFDLNKFEFSPEVGEQISEQIGSIRNKPVKINAAGFNGQLHILQSILQTVFAAVHVSCPLILNLSMNGLRDSDLLPLLEFMKIKPIIYQLNLDGNPLSKGSQLSEEIIQLFQISSPISHLYLNQTGFNDATALGLRDVLGKHPCLTHLDLRSNALSEVGTKALMDATVPASTEGVAQANGVLQTVRLQNNKFKTAEVIALAASVLGPRSMHIVQLEDMTIFSPNFSQDALNQQKIHVQAMESQRL